MNHSLKVNKKLSKLRPNQTTPIKCRGGNLLTLTIGMMSDSFSFLPLRGQIISLGRISLSTHSMVTMSPLGILHHQYSIRAYIPTRRHTHTQSHIHSHTHVHAILLCTRTHTHTHTLNNKPYVDLSTAQGMELPRTS